jgi:hypothetical protein
VCTCVGGREGGKEGEGGRGVGEGEKGQVLAAIREDAVIREHRVLTKQTMLTKQTTITCRRWGHWFGIARARVQFCRPA